MFCTGSSLVASSGASSCSAFSLRGKGCRHAGFSSWGLQAWFLPACGSSWTRGQTRVPCIGRWILVHCTTREVLTCAVLITGALWLRLRFGGLRLRGESSAGLCFFFFSHIDLTILVFVNFHVNFRASSSVYWKRPAGILIEITLNLRIHLGSLAI